MGRMVACLVMAIIFMFYTSSCKLTEKTIAGHYSNYFNFETSTELDVRAENRFDFQQQIGLVFLKSSGQWHIDGDTLYLINEDTVNAFEGLKQLKFLIRGQKLTEININKLRAETLKRRRKNVGDNDGNKLK